MKTDIPKRKLFMGISYTVLFICIILLILLSMDYQRDGPTVKSVDYVNSGRASIDGGPWIDISLPHIFEDLEPRTKVVFEADILPDFEDSVFIKTVYSPAQVYFDGKKVFEFGKMENYPSFMKDPATEIHVIEAYGTGKPMKLRIDFFSPATRKSLAIHPPMVGTAKELIMERSRVLGIPLIFSMAQIVGGALLVIVSLCIVLVEKKSLLFLHLGFFAFSTGVWAFCENNFSGIIFRHSAILYLLSFMGMFTLIIPLLGFTRNLIDFKNPTPIIIMEGFFTLTAIAALILQLTGTVAFSQSMYLFHLLLPPSILFITVLTIREYYKFKNLNAKRFIIPISALSASAILELINYRNPFTYVFSSVFQMGILFFLMVMGIIAGYFIKDSILLRSKQKELEFENGLMEISLNEQNNQTKIILEKEALLKQQRHDLKHHLNALKEMICSGNDKVAEYIDQIIEAIPQKTEQFCENNAVNAIISHYNSICCDKGISVTLHLDVPSEIKTVSDAELCAVFGNLLENAVEACMRMETGEKFIKLNSHVHYDILTVTMDNSFNGKISVKDHRFLSSKRESYGIGTSSVISIAHKAGGNAQFEAKGNVFLSSVYLKLN